MELAAIAGLSAALLSAIDTAPYVRDTVRGSTVPHRGTWLVWSVLGVVAVESQRADGARWSLVPLVIQASGTLLVLGLAVRLGTGGLTRLDAVLIAVAGVGVAGWATVHEPVVATGCVIVADLVAALMMLPKTWRDPHSETQATFVLAALSGAARRRLGRRPVRAAAGLPGVLRARQRPAGLGHRPRRRARPVVVGTPAARAERGAAEALVR